MGKYGQSSLGTDYPQQNRNRARPNQVSNVPALPSIPSNGQSGNGRMRQLEGRINMSEQSNRALLEELVRLQGELKQNIRRNEETLQDEREERVMLAEKIRAANSLYAQVTMRLARTEEKLEHERNTVGNLVNHTKSVEQALAGTHQELMTRREQGHVHTERLREDVSEMRETQEQMQKNMRAMIDDMRGLKTRFESQLNQFASVAQEVRQKVRKVENENKLALDSLNRQQNERGSIQNDSVQLRNNVEIRMSEMKEAIADLRRKLELEESQRRSSEQQTALSLQQIRTSVDEVDRKREENAYASAMSVREKENALESEKTLLSSKVTELAEEQSKKLLNKEIRLREDAQAKFANLEKRQREEQHARLLFEKNVREEMERRWVALKSYVDEEMQNIRESNKSSQVRNDSSLTRLNESIVLLERQMDEGKKSVEQVLHAEITSRQNQNEKMSARITDLQDKLNLAIGTLQQAVGGITAQLQEYVAKAKHEMQTLLDGVGNAGVRGLSDLDNRLTNVAKRVNDLEKELTDKLDQLTVVEQNQREEKMNDLAKWQQETDTTLQEMQQELQPLPEDISRIRKDLLELQLDLESKIDELNNRPPPKPRTPRERTPPPKEPTAPPREKTPEPKQSTPEPKQSTPEPRETTPEKDQEDKEKEDQTSAEIEELKHRIIRVEEELEKGTTQLTKLESTVQTLRTVLSQKIQSETQTREESIDVLKSQLSQIQPEHDNLSE